MLVISNSVSRAKTVESIRSLGGPYKVNRRHTQRCKTDRSYAEAHKG
jgi:hypothetical protein